MLAERARARCQARDGRIEKETVARRHVDCSSTLLLSAAPSYSIAGSDINQNKARIIPRTGRFRLLRFLTGLTCNKGGGSGGAWLSAAVGLAGLLVVRPLLLMILVEKLLTRRERRENGTAAAFAFAQRHGNFILTVRHNDVDGGHLKPNTFYE